MPQIRGLFRSFNEPLRGQPSWRFISGDKRRAEPPGEDVAEPGHRHVARSRRPAPRRDIGSARQMPLNLAQQLQDVFIRRPLLGHANYPNGKPEDGAVLRS